MKRIFITGIGTGVGKTIVSAIVAEALQADYWKPVQTGASEGTDSETVRELISNKKTVIHPESYLLQKPVSPHEAAADENERIEVRKIKLPKTSNTLVIEGAGGLLVPLNSKETMLDLIRFLEADVILVVRHYLGSINHTLLTGEALKASGINVAGIIYSGNPNRASEEAISNFLPYKVLGRVGEEETLTKAKVSHYVMELKPLLLSLQRNNIPTGTMQ